MYSLVPAYCIYGQTTQLQVVKKLGGGGGAVNFYLAWKLNVVTVNV
jgi:hypothetical protein